MLEEKKGRLVLVFEGIARVVDELESLTSLSGVTIDHHQAGILNATGEKCRREESRFLCWWQYCSQACQCG